MVKSFKGLQITKEAALTPVLVRDYMATRLIKFRPEQSIIEVMDILLSKGIAGGPVVNEDNELVGMISEGDCLKQVVRGRYNNMPIYSGTVEEFMAKDVITIRPEINIFEVAHMFLNKRLRRFPVVKDGQLLGQISQKDVMRAFRNM
jgi:predicted transcriptional regulator